MSVRSIHCSMKPSDGIDWLNNQDLPQRAQRSTEKVTKGFFNVSFVFSVPLLYGERCAFMNVDTYDTLFLSRS